MFYVRKCLYCSSLYKMGSELIFFLLSPFLIPLSPLFDGEKRVTNFSCLILVKMFSVSFISSYLNFPMLLFLNPLFMSSIIGLRSSFTNTLTN